MKRKVFYEGVRYGIPIGLGYFAVSFSLGIMAKSAGLNWIQGFIASMLNMASAGEYALFSSIAQNVTYVEVAVITFIINARYLLMSCSLSQKFNKETSLLHRMLVGAVVTDEIFGITISREGYIDPWFNYGAIAFSVPCWSVGTALGIIAGNVLPANIVSALSVALYGMFIAIIIPPGKKDKIIMAAVCVSFLMSYLFSVLPVVSALSDGNRTIILTVVIAAIVAVVKPVEDEEEAKSNA